jgi:hypothetical protein
MRSKGIGRPVPTFLARLAKEKGCGQVEWTAAVANERGLACYRSVWATVRERIRL